MSVARFTFGPRLKAHRERQGITLQDIAESTKIGVSLLAALERNDVSQWPKGIFRRAFLRSYARAIDVPFEATWAEFVRLFPEDGAPATPLPPEPSELRLTLATPPRRLIAPSGRTLVAAAVDLVVVLSASALVALAMGVSFWITLAVVGLVYAATGTGLTGGSLAHAWLQAGRSRARTRQESAPAPVTLTDTGERSVPATRAIDDLRADSQEAPPAPPRPRIVAVAANRSTAHDRRERRVADR